MGVCLCRLGWEARGRGTNPRVGLGASLNRQWPERLQGEQSRENTPAISPMLDPRHALHVIGMCAEAVSGLERGRSL